MEVTLNFGKTGLALSLPEDWSIDLIRKKPMPLLADPHGAVAQALTRPVDGPALTQAAAGARSACILICDITRPVPNGLFLRPVIEGLLAAGLKREKITVLVATGLHRPNEGQELRELVGDDWVLENVAVVNHFARRDEDHARLGLTPRGTHIRLDRRFVEADFKLATGLVEPHFMAGYSGGRKVIVPGICHQEAITRIHTAEFLEHPRAANCVLEGNPLHEEQLDIVRRLGPVWAVNTVIDEERRLGFVNFGPLEPSHATAVAFMRQFAEVPLARRYQTVVTSSAGYPLDQTYYQTVKGMVGAMDALAPGGKMFIASACSLGLGSTEFAASQARLVKLGPVAFLKEIEPKRFSAVDEWETEMLVKPLRVGAIALYSPGLKPAERALTGVEMVDDLGAAIRAWVDRCGDQAVAVIPEGPYVVPRRA
jgi:nickel-dependent lactate racemase